MNSEIDPIPCNACGQDFIGMDFSKTGTPWTMEHFRFAAQPLAMQKWLDQKGLCKSCRRKKKGAT